MKHCTFPFILFLILAFSCSSNETRNYEFVNSTTMYLARLNFELIEENNRTLAYLSTSNPKLDSIRSIRLRILEQINSKSNKIVELCGGYNEYMGYQDPFSMKKVTSFFIENGKAIEMKNSMNLEIEGAEKMGLKVWRKFMDIRDSSELKNHPNVENLTFHQIHFENKFLYESLYSLELFKNEILHSERGYLTNLLIEQNGK